MPAGRPLRVDEVDVAAQPGEDDDERRSWIVSLRMPYRLRHQV